MARKLLLLVNPISGKNRVKTDLLGILKIFSDADFTTTVHVTRRAGDATEKVVESGRAYDVIVACGGDGTLNEVAAGAAGYPNAAVTVFSGGSGNDFVKIFNDTEPFKDLEQLLAEGHFSGVVLDVMDPEPLTESSSLWNCERVLLTPHISGIGFGHEDATESIIWDICRENLRRYAAGLPLCHVVDVAAGY